MLVQNTKLVLQRVATRRKTLLVHRKAYHVELDRKQNIQPEVFRKNFRSNVLHRGEFDTAGPTTVEDILRLCFGNTATTVRLAKKPCTEYDTVVVQSVAIRRKSSLLTVSIIIWKSNGSKSFQRTFLVKSSGWVFCLEKGSICYGIQCTSGCMFCVCLTNIYFFLNCTLLLQYM